MYDNDPLTSLRFLRRPHTQRNQPDTLTLLQVGLQLMVESLGGSNKGTESSMTFRWPSRARVVARFNDVTRRKMTKTVFEDRWATMPEFYADLFGWALHHGHWLHHEAVATQSASAIVQSGPVLGDVAKDVAMAELAALLNTPHFRMKLLVCAMDPVEPRFRQVIAELYESARERRESAYAEVFDAAKLSLRDGVDFPTFSTLLTALTEGIALRYLGCPDSFADDLDRAARILSIGAMVLFAGASTALPKTESLEEFFRARFANE